MAPRESCWRACRHIDWRHVGFGPMLFHGLAVAVVGLLRIPPWRYRRLGLGESIQLQGGDQGCEARAFSTASMNSGSSGLVRLEKSAITLPFLSTTYL